MHQDLGIARERAAKLAQWAWGQCSAPVAERPPPKSLSVQMSLTPVPLAMHPSFEGKSVCGHAPSGAHPPLDDIAATSRKVHLQSCQLNASSRT